MLSNLKVIDNSGINPGSYSPNNLLEVQSPDSIELDHETSEVLLVYGTGEEETLISNITEVGDYIVRYKFRDIHKIPHDFVHMSFARIMESEVIDGLTPDVVLHDGSDTHVYEISTTRSNYRKSQRDDVIMKLNKYKHLQSSGKITTLSAISVSRLGVCTNLSNHEDFCISSAILVDALTKGYKLVSEIETKLNLPPDPGSYYQSQQILEKYPWPSVPCEGREDQCFITDEYVELVSSIDPIHSFSLYHPTIKVPEINDWFKDEGRIDNGAIASVPVFHYSDNVSGVQSILIDRGHNRTATLAITVLPEFKVDLRKYVEDKPEIKSQTENVSLRYISLTISERIDIAKRGVTGKSLSANSELEAHRKAKQESLNPSQTTADLERWLETPLRITLSSNYKIPNSIDDMIMCDGTKYDALRILKLMAQTDWINSICMFQKILLEVILEMKMNPRDRDDNLMFVVKPIDEYTSVVIRPTRYGGMTESHTFYQVVTFKPITTYPGITESFYTTTFGAHATKFCSITRTRAEHYINICEQILSLWFMLMDEVGGGLTNSTSIDQLISLSKPLKYLSLILLEGKEYTSRNLQQLRYYYMDLLSTGGPSDKNWKFLSKLDTNVRSKIMIYTMRSLKTIHESGTIRVHVLKEEPDNGDDDEPFESRLLKANEIKELQISIATPAGYLASTMQQLLIMMYVSVLHNKNESETTLAAKQIVSKVVKMECELKTTKHAKGDLSELVDTRTYGAHDWSLRIVKSASLKMKERLEAKHGDLHIIAAQTLSETWLSELATTKSSHSGNDLSIIEDESEIRDRTKRTKCFIEYMRHSKNFTGCRLSDNIPYLVGQMQVNNGSRVHVKMFKKNQIGGTREILILDFVSRCLIRCLEDISRGIAQICEIDMLTKPKVKNIVLREHMKRTRLLPYKFTKRYSLDKTTWSQRFVNPVFFTLLSTLMPKYTEFFKFILNCHTRKLLELPPALIRSFLKSTNSNLTDFEVDKLWREFHDIDPEYLLGSHKINMTNCSNMMQGILHYTSTILHCSYMYYLQGEVERIRLMMSKRLSKELQVELSMQVSSDDSGILLTLAQENLSTSTATGFFTAVEAVMWSLEPAFCMKTSIEKSTITTLPIYEFNSVFHSGNNISCPLIKYVARVCDDQVHESLKARVESLYSSLREVRSNGGSGVLCHSLGVLQHLSLMNSFGLKVFNQFDEYSKPIYRSKLSIMGAYMIHPPMLSGVFNSDFSDYYVCKNSEDSLRMMSATRRRPDLLQDDDQVDRLVYRMWPSKKYFNCLDRLGIDRQSLLNESFDKLRPLLVLPSNIAEMTGKIELSLLNYSLARCFAVLSRTDNQFAQAYILWDKIFKVGDEKLTLEQYEKLLMESSIDPDLRIFPLRHDYDFYITMIKKPVHLHHTGKLYTMQQQGYATMHSTLPSSREMTQLLLHDWYSESNISDRSAKVIRDKIMILYPWYCVDRDSCLTESGLKTPLQLINFITSFTDRNWGFSFIAAGSSKSYKNIIEGLTPLNTYRNKHISFINQASTVVERYDPSTATRSQLIRAFENRIMDWNFLATCVRDQQQHGVLTRALLGDIIPLIEDHLDELKLGIVDTNDDFIRHSILALRWSSHLYEAIRSINKTQILYRQAQRRMPNGEWKGLGEVLYHTPRGSAMIFYYDREIRSIKCTNAAMSFDRLYDTLNIGPTEHTTITYVELEELVPRPESLRFYKGSTRASLEIVDGYQKPILRFEVRPRISDFRLVSKDTTDPLLRLWLDRESDPMIWSMMMSRSKLRKMFIEVARHVVEGVQVPDRRMYSSKEKVIPRVVNQHSQQTGNIDDYLDLVMLALQSPDNGEEVEQNFDVTDFLVDTDPSIYFSTDVGRLLYHPFIQFFTTDYHKYLPGLLATIRVYLQYITDGGLPESLLQRFSATDTLSDEMLEQIGVWEFTDYVKSVRDSVMDSIPGFRDITPRIISRAFE